MEEENRRILEFAKEQQNREEERMEKRKQAEEAMTKVQERVSSYGVGDNGVWYRLAKTLMVIVVIDDG